MTGPVKVLVVDELSLGLAPIVVKRLTPVLEQVAGTGVGVLLIEQFAHVALAVATTAHVLEGGTIDGEGDLLGDGSVGGNGGGEKDPMYDQAVEVVLKNRRASISLVQRHLKIGYNRAARLVEDMEKAGLVSAMSGSGQREILVPARAE